MFGRREKRRLLRHWAEENARGAEYHRKAGDHEAATYYRGRADAFRHALALVYAVHVPEFVEADDPT